MADLVTIKKLSETNEIYTQLLTNISDGTGETFVYKLVGNSLKLDGNTVDKLTVLSIEYIVSNMDYVLIENEGSSSDTTIAVLAGSGYMDFREHGGCEGTGGGEAIVITTSGQASGAIYDIIITYLKTT